MAVVARGPNLASMIRALPSRPGVYRFRDGADAVLYVGRAAQLRDRVASYWSDLGDRRHLTPMVNAVRRIEAVECASRHEAAWLERNLLDVRLSRWNRTAGGQEVPVVIGLDTRLATPGLHVTHLPYNARDGVAYFGPYLGGLQVRRAVSGLHRLHPLRYAGAQLGATEHAMGHPRGVTERDRDVLVAALTAILHREPAAVQRARTGLTDLRQGAAAGEAFELAARVHAELEAVDWITSPQRVTALADEDIDIAGISGKICVTFSVRAGRLISWTTCGSDHADIASLVAATPSSWRDFAQRNAELAAALDRQTR